MIRIKITSAVILCLVLIGAAAWAQTAAITGEITDQSKAALPGVTVSVTSQLTNVKTVAESNERGYYTVLNLSPGVYRVEAELPGFKKYVHPDLTLDVDQTARINIQMQIGQITDEVRVTAEAPVLNTENAAKGSVVYNQEITDLPVESRDFSDLVFLTVGVVPKQEGAQGGYASINGSRMDSMNYVLDGGNNSIMRGGDAFVRPSLDSIQEFKVHTSNYSAEYGRRSTGVINVILRSGTNSFHGSLFEFHRNSIFDARSYFDQNKPKLVRNNFGGTLGGPVIRNKTFFFASYEGWYLRQGNTRLQRTPTLAERAGYFSSLLPGIKIKDPLTGKDLANNIIPASRFHTTSLKIMESFPLPNTSRGPYNYVTSKSDADDYHDFVTKLDHHFWQADSLSLRYLHNRRYLDEPFNGSDFPGFGRSGPQSLTGAGINWTHTWTPRLITQALVNFSRKDQDFIGYTQGTDYCARFGIAGCTKDPQLIGFPRITIKGIGGIGEANANPLDWTENDYHFNSTTSIVTGTHGIRFGGDMIRTQFFELFSDNSRGLFNFQERWTGDPFGDFLMGFLNNTNRRVKVAKNYLLSRTWAGFLQDDWKLRHNLTVNLGLRWDYFGPPTDKYGNWSNFIPELGRTVMSGEAGFPKSLVFARKTNFAPRLGLAWRVRNKTVVRAGIGQFYGLSIQGPLNNSLGANPPFSVRENYSRLASKPLLLTWDSPFPPERATIDGISSPSGYETHPNAANLYQYNLTIEQELVRNLAWEIGYMGSKGTHLGRRYNINQLYYTLQPDGKVTSSRAFPAFSSIDYYAFEANSHYHALQTSVLKRGHGMNLRINYSFSKSIDDSSRLSGSSDQGVDGVQDARHRNLERGLSDFDRRHALLASAIYRIPFRSNFLIRDWQVNAIIAYYSGTPISPRIANADLAAGEATRPDRIGSGFLENPTPDMWFKVADFPAVPAGSFRFGNTGRNVVAGPATKKWDISLMRSFPTPWERHRLQFRWEVFDVPNYANFRAVEEQVNIPTAGAIRAAYPGRQMQFSLKYTF